MPLTNKHKQPSIRASRAAILALMNMNVNADADEATRRCATWANGIDAARTMEEEKVYTRKIKISKNLRMKRE